MAHVSLLSSSTGVAYAAILPPAVLVFVMIAATAFGGTTSTSWSSLKASIDFGTELRVEPVLERKSICTVAAEPAVS